MGEISVIGLALRACQCHNLRAAHELRFAEEGEASPEVRPRGRETVDRARARQAASRPGVREPADKQELTSSSGPIAVTVICRAACTSGLRYHVPPLAELHLLNVFAVSTGEAREGAATGGIAHYITVIYGGGADACIGIIGEADARTELP